MDRDMLAQIFWEHRARLLRLSASILGNAADAEDAVSDAAVRAFRSADSLRDPDRALAWLLSIAARASCDLIRSRGRERRAVQGYGEEALRAGTSAPDAVYPLLLRLPAPDRQVLLLYYYEDMCAREIAQVLGASVAAVNMRLMRGRRRLQKILTEEGVIADASKRT